MRRVGYFLTDSREPAEIDRQVATLKMYHTDIEFADYIKINYKERGQLTRAISILKANDRLVVKDVECFGTTIREISRNLRRIKERDAKIFVINKDQSLTYGTNGNKFFDYVNVAHNLLLHLSRYRSELGRRTRRTPAKKHKKAGSGRPPRITQAVIIEAREWITDETNIQDIQDRWGVSRATAYRIKKAYRQRFRFDVELDRID